MKIKFINSNDQEVSYPSIMEICEVCHGRGTHTNPSIDGNGLTSSDLEDWDDETWHNYRSGFYDVSCWFCNGEKVVEVIDTDAVDMNNKSTFEDVNYWFDQFYDKLSYTRRNIRRAGGAYIAEDYY